MTYLIHPATQGMGDLTGAQVVESQLCELANGSYLFARTAWAPDPVDADAAGDEPAGAPLPPLTYTIARPSTSGEADWNDIASSDTATICDLTGSVYVGRVRYSPFNVFIGTILASDGGGLASTTLLLASNGDDA